MRHTRLTSTILTGALVILAALALSACSGRGDGTPTPTEAPSSAATTSPPTSSEATATAVTPTPPSVAMAISSPAFAIDGPIPEKYTCDGDDISPPMVVSEIPGSTETLALVVSDASAANFVHWVAWNIPVDALDGGTLPEGALPAGSAEGTNGFQEVGWAGPCPPSGAPHRYIFYVYALEGSLTLPESTTATQLREAMAPYVIFAAETMGQYPAE